MIRIAAWRVEAGGREWTVEPLTVRQRIALVEAIADERAKRAIEDAKSVGLHGQAAVDAARSARDSARIASFIVNQCFTLDGAHRILRIAAGDEGADAIATHLEPLAASQVALEAIGIDVEARGRAEGKA
jgi:hypothetical protein